MKVYSISFNGSSGYVYLFVVQKDELGGVNLVTQPSKIISIGQLQVCRQRVCTLSNSFDWKQSQPKSSLMLQRPRTGGFTAEIYEWNSHISDRSLHLAISCSILGTGRSVGEYSFKDLMVRSIKKWIYNFVLICSKFSSNWNKI